MTEEMEFKFQDWKVIPSYGGYFCLELENIVLFSGFQSSRLESSNGTLSQQASDFKLEPGARGDKVTPQWFAAHTKHVITHTLAALHHQKSEAASQN